MLLLLLLVVAVSSSLISSTTATHLSFPLSRRTITGLSAARAWRHTLSSEQRRLYKDIAKVHKESDGVYFSTICIGITGNQCFSVIVDTGSSTIAVPCKGCNCGSQHNYYNKALSTSAVDTGSSYSQCYGEGSCNRGELISDIMCFGKDCSMETGINHPFGCCSTFSANFKSQDADGIIGVSPSGRTLWKDLATHHKLDNNRLAICFGTTDGEMSVGGWDETIPGVGNMSASESLQWTDMKTSDAFYRIDIQSIVIDGIDSSNGQSSTSGGMAVPNYHVSKPMVDCGSTFSFMRNPNWGRLRDSLIKYCSDDTAERCKSEAGRNPGGDEAGDADLSLGCYKFSTNANKRQEQMATFPSITFQFQQSDAESSDENKMVNMCVPADQYFFLSGPKANVYCGGIFRDSQDVIGANLLANFLVVFQETPQRMGIARAQCDRNSAPGSASLPKLSPAAAGGSGTVGPCGSPLNSVPSSSSSGDGMFNLNNISLTTVLGIIGGVVFTCACLKLLTKCCQTFCRYCRGNKKYSALEGSDENDKTLGIDNDGDSDGIGSTEGDDDSRFEVELTDQEKARTEELVRAADAMFAAVENGGEGEASIPVTATAALNSEDDAAI